MPNTDYCRRIVSALTVLQILARTKAKQVVTIASMLLVTLTCTFICAAQDQSPTTSQTAAANSAPADTSRSEVVTIPASTRLALVLTNPVSSKTMHRGDVVYAQTTAPVIVGDRAVIPAGIFVQGKIEKLTRRSSHAEMLMNSAAIVFPNGYAANIPGPIDVETDEGTAWRDPSSAARTGAFIAPFAGAGMGAAIGSSLHTTQSATLGGTTITSNSPKGIGIGAVVGSGGGCHSIDLPSAAQPPLLCGRRFAHGNDPGAAANFIRKSGCGGDSTSQRTSRRRSHGRPATATSSALRSRHLLHGGSARDSANSNSGHSGDRR